MVPTFYGLSKCQGYKGFSLALQSLHAMITSFEVLTEVCFLLLEIVLNKWETEKKLQELFQEGIKEKKQILQQNEKLIQALLLERQVEKEKDRSTLGLGTIVLYCCLCVHCLHYNTSELNNVEYGNSQYRSNCPCIRNNDEIHTCRSELCLPYMV